VRCGEAKNGKTSEVKVKVIVGVGVVVYGAVCVQGSTVTQLATGDEWVNSSCAAGVGNGHWAVGGANLRTVGCTGFGGALTKSGWGRSERSMYTSEASR
jgi:hypothetical protein